MQIKHKKLLNLGPWWVLSFSFYNCNLLPKSQTEHFMLSFLSQLFHDPDGFGFRKKAGMYINDLWNILDVLSILLFSVGLAFR